MEPKISPQTSAIESDPVVLFQQVLRSEAEALTAGAFRAGVEIEQAVQILKATAGQVVVTGLGKAGCVARKAAATFCSTGTPANFLHPSEALHGDLGRVTSRDTLIAISNSGETEEVLALLPYLARIGSPVISVTGNVHSSLAHRSTVVIDASVEREADPIALAPTCSTTLAMAICDALAVTLMAGRGFTREQFAIFHPGGSLGRKLLLTVSDLMRTGERMPVVSVGSPLSTAISVMSAKKMGAVFVTDHQAAVLGVLTDGDLRRWYQQSREANDPGHHPRNSDPTVDTVMTRQPQQIAAEALAAEAIKRMEDCQISVLPVINSAAKLCGAIHLHDLIRAGLA